MLGTVVSNMKAMIQKWYDAGEERTRGIRRQKKSKRIAQKVFTELDRDNPSLIWHSKRFSGPVILTGMPISAFLWFPFDFCISEKNVTESRLMPIFSKYCYHGLNLNLGFVRRDTPHYFRALSIT